MAVYFPSCLSRTLDALPGEPGGPSLPEAFVLLADRAGQPVWIPADVAGHCCGVPFSSKGYVKAHAAMVNRTVARLWEWSDEGRLPIVVDTTPCTYGLRTSKGQLSEANRERFDHLRILDGIEFVADMLLPRLTVHTREETTLIHPVCAVEKLGLRSPLERIVAAASRDLRVPVSAGCCGFAGDRGWLFPELTESALAAEAREVAGIPADGHYASSRTCEIGLTRATGRTYRSYIHLLEQATRDPAGDGGHSP